MRVNILIPTYQHARFIARTIEGCLMQQTTFPFDLVIGDDGSTDGAPEVIRRYAAQYPGRIRAFLHPENLGPVEPRELGGKNNVRFLFEQCEAPYIALCEGDDYWTDPGKLQRQVAFLDARPEYALCFHNVTVHYEDGTPSHPFNEPLGRTTFSLDDLLTDRWFVPTCSTLFRNTYRAGFPDWFHRMAGGDLGIFILAAEHGLLHYHAEIGGVYRRHRGGLSNQHTALNRGYLQNRLELFTAYERLLSGAAL
jgi:glycosyltransferase involved in cell wall biosynthesis